VTDISGRRVYQPSFKGNATHSFDLSGLPSGMYFVRISTEKTFQNTQIVIE
jgi:hypothetical protein